MRARPRTAVLLAAAVLLGLTAGRASSAALQTPAENAFGARDASSAQQTPAENAFTARDASALLRRLGEALDGHSEKKMLALFNLAQMKDGPIFRQQLSALFAQSESIRVHLNLADAASEDQMAVDAEIEIQPVNGGPPARRNERVNFKVARAGSGWKFVEVQPRSFFSLP